MLLKFTIFVLATVGCMLSHLVNAEQPELQQIRDTILCQPFDYGKNVDVGLGFTYGSKKAQDGVTVYLFDQNCTILDSAHKLWPNSDFIFKGGRLPGSFHITIDQWPLNADDHGLARFAWDTTERVQYPIYHPIDYGLRHNQWSPCTCRNSAKEKRGKKACGGADLCCGCMAGNDDIFPQPIDAIEPAHTRALMGPSPVAGPVAYVTDPA